MCNFSLQFQYVILQTSYENKHPYQLDGVILIKHQILLSSLKVKWMAVSGENF